MLRLYSYFRSSAAYRVRIGLNVKAIEYDQVAVNLVENEQRSDAYLDVNPQGLVPALRLEEGKLITQSTAILEWLEEQYPRPALYPADSMERATARALCNTLACDIHPLNNLRVLQYLMGELGATEEQKVAWYQHWIDLGFESLERQLSGSPYALGDSVSMVDLYLVPQVYNALRFKQEMGAYPKIMHLYEACCGLDSFRLAAPESQPDVAP